MSNARRFRRRHRPLPVEYAPGDPNEPSQARAARLAARKLKAESPGQYRVLKVGYTVFVALMAVLVLMLVVGGIVRLVQFLA